MASSLMLCLKSIFFFLEKVFQNWALCAKHSKEFMKSFKVTADIWMTEMNIQSTWAVH